MRMPKDVDLLPRTGVMDLVGEHALPSVSLFMPTERIAVQADQDPIRFERLLELAEKELTKKGFRSPDARTFLQPAYDLLDSSNLFFWKHQGYGLALFVSNDTHYPFRLPFPVGEHVHVSHRFYIKPLLSFFSPGYFYVLQLKADSIRLLQGTPSGIQEMEPAGTPLNELFDFSELKRLVTFKTESPIKVDPDDMLAFSGDSVGINDTRDDLYEYFRRIDLTLFEFLRNERAPLLLAGIRALFPVYEQANSYEFLVREQISEDFRDLSDDQVHAQAWSILEPGFHRSIRGAFNRFGNLTSRDLSTNDLEKIVPAALGGRIDTLFIPNEMERWGKVQEGTMDVELMEECSEHGMDLIDVAAAHTLLRAGSVYVVEPSHIPGSGPVAALLRY